MGTTDVYVHLRNKRSTLLDTETPTPEKREVSFTQKPHTGMYRLPSHDGLSPDDRLRIHATKYTQTDGKFKSGFEQNGT